MRLNAAEEILCRGWGRPVQAFQIDGHFANRKLNELSAVELAEFRVVTTKIGALEKRDEIVRRVEEAARFVPLDRLALSPQCGFASSGRGNPLSVDEQWAKLKLVADVAQQVWSRV